MIRYHQTTTQGDAGDPDYAGRVRGVDDGAVEQAKVLQRPLPDGSLDIVARGVKKDEGPSFEPTQPSTPTHAAPTLTPRSS